MPLDTHSAFPELKSAAEVAVASAARGDGQHSQQRGDALGRCICVAVFKPDISSSINSLITLVVEFSVETEHQFSSS